MMRRTHIAGGVLATTVLIIYTPVVVLPSLLGIIGSVVPDWDYIIGFKHRGMSHSLLITIVLGVLGYLINPSFGIVFACNYLLHLCMDSLTKKGVAVFAPFNWNYYGLKLFKTRSSEDMFIGLLLIYILSEIVAKI